MGTLFVLVAISAVLTAAVTPVLRAVADDRLKWSDPAMAVGTGAMILGFLGFCAGGLYFPHWRGLLTGGFAGICVGLIAGPLVLVESRDLLPAALEMCVGSVISVAIAAAMRKKGD